MSAILSQADLIGIGSDASTDEYDSEAETIGLRLGEAHGTGDVQRTAHEEFARWSGPQVAGPRERCAGVGREVWAAANRQPRP